jgi:hypothetical protein
VGVAPLALVPRVAVPLVGDAHTAGEPGLLVDDHDLAMGPVVRLGGPEPMQRSEPPDANTRVVHHVDQGAVEPMGAPGIQEHADPNARQGPLGQRLGEGRADLASPVDEGQKVDRVLRPGDGLEHRGEDLVAVAEDVDATPLGRRDPEDPFERATDLIRAISGCVIGPARVHRHAHDAAPTALGRA